MQLFSSYQVRFSEICGEIDINIEESTGLIYEDDLEQAQLHMQIALKKLNSAAPLFEKLYLRNQQFLQGGPSTQSSSSENQNPSSQNSKEQQLQQQQLLQKPEIQNGVNNQNNNDAPQKPHNGFIHHQHTQSSSIALQNEQLQKIYSVVINYNMAACYQRRGIFKESHEYIIKAIDSLKFLAQDSTYLSCLEPHSSGRITPITVQSYPISSTVNQQQNQISHKYKQLIYLRYYAQIVLQSCAIKSQLQDHDGALNSAFDGLISCIKVFKKSLDLCESEIIEKINQSKQQETQNKNQEVNKQKDEGLNNQFKRNQNLMEMESINSEYGYSGAPAETKKRNEQFVQSQKSDRSNGKMRQNGKSLSTTKNQNFESPLENIQRPQRQSLGGPAMILKESTASSKISTPERQHSEGRSSQGGVSQGSTKRRLRSRDLRQQSITSSVRFHLSESEDEQTSLERIHTFNLKAETNRSQSSISKDESNSNKSQLTDKQKKTKKKSQIKSLKQLLNVKVIKKSNDSTLSIEKKRDLSQVSSQLLSQSTRDHFNSTKVNRLNPNDDKSLLKNQKLKQCYVEEAAKLRDSFIIESYRILKSLIKNIEIFFVHLLQDNSTQKLSFLKDRDIALEGLDIDKFMLAIEVSQQRMAKLFTEFHSLQQIEHLRKIDRYKYVGRNMLGVRKFDDWINNLEIGNIMHLNPITTQELMQNIGKHHEFQKDPMLKKLVLLSVSLFSIATEMRMMVQFDQKDKEIKETLQKSSELWHAQSVFFGSYYLPANCPLVTHIGNSYNKHYIINKKPLSPKVQLAQSNQLSQKKDSFQKNKVLQNFLNNQQTNVTQVPQKVTLNNSITNQDKSLSYNGNGGVSSSYENNTSDNQDHQVLTEQQKHRPIVSLTTINPVYQISGTGGIIKRVKVDSSKMKLQLKKGNLSSKFQSESSVSPIRQENEEAQFLETMKKTRYEKLSKFLKAKEMQQQKLEIQKDKKQDDILRILEKSFSPRQKSSQELFKNFQKFNTQPNQYVSLDQVIQESLRTANLTQHINSIAINQINSINIYPQSTKNIDNQGKNPNSQDIKLLLSHTPAQKSQKPTTNFAEQQFSNMVIPTGKQKNANILQQNSQQNVNKTHLQVKNSLNNQLTVLSMSQTRDNSTGQKKKQSLPIHGQTLRPGSSKGELIKQRVQKKVVQKANYTPSRQSSKQSHPSSLSENLGLILMQKSQQKVSNASQTKRERKDQILDPDNYNSSKYQQIREQLNSQSQLSNYHPNVKLNNFLQDSSQQQDQNNLYIKSQQKPQTALSSAQKQNHQYLLNQLDLAQQNQINHGLNMIDNHQNLQLRLVKQQAQTQQQLSSSNYNQSKNQYNNQHQNHLLQPQNYHQSNFQQAMEHQQKIGSQQQSQNFQQYQFQNNQQVLQHQISLSQNSQNKNQKSVQQQQSHINQQIISHQRANHQIAQNDPQFSANQYAQQMHYNNLSNEEWKLDEASPKLRVRRSPPANSSQYQ